MDLSYILNHLGEPREEYYGAVAPPVFQSSNFCFTSTHEMRERLVRELETPFYTRGYNPITAMLRQKLAALEGTEDALVFASGSAAVAAAVMSVVKAGDHVVCVQKPYSWTFSLLAKYLDKYNVKATFVDGTSVSGFENALRAETTLIYLESPNSLTFELQDVEAVVKLARAKKITTILDNSYNSPLNQNPAAMGVDLVLHSATKYLNGHSDAVGGVVCGSHERIAKMMKEEFMTLGGIISPHDAWLMLRGLRTLELRVGRSAESAQHLAGYLEAHPKVKKVYYPFLKSNPQFALAQKQMKRGGGLLSVEMNCERVEQVEKFCDSLNYFLLATSWGGYESLVFPMCAIASSQSFRDKSMPWNLVRLYIGLEDVNVLQADLKQALEKI